VRGHNGNALRCRRGDFARRCHGAKR
jgi:hypothetical protein